MTATETVVLITRTQTGLDAQKRPIYSTIESNLTDALVDPGGSTEPAEAGRTPILTTPTVYFRGEELTIDPTAQMRVRGTTYDIDGHPSVWAGSPGGTIVRLKRAEG